jgi:Trk K+ transport system NAD-binding subunit
LRNKYNISILAVRGLVPESITMNPGGSFTVKDSDILIVLGKPDDIEKIKA